MLDDFEQKIADFSKETYDGKKYKKDKRKQGTTNKGR